MFPEDWDLYAGRYFLCLGHFTGEMVMVVPRPPARSYPRVVMTACLLSSFLVWEAGMKRLLIPALLGLLTLGATAQTQPDSEVRIRGRQIELPAQPYRMWQTDFRSFVGEYDLSNGETMKLIARGPRMYAEIGARPRTEMLASKNNEFVAVDRQFKMNLALDRDEVTGEVLLRVPASGSQANADGGEVIRMVASR